LKNQDPANNTPPYSA